MVSDYHDEVNNGFHVLRNLEQARKFANDFPRSAKVFLVMIPKGALYHKNSTQYCSNQLVIKTKLQ